MTALLGLGSIAAFADGEEGTGLALGAIGGLFVASAVRGNSAANACRVTASTASRTSRAAGQAGRPALDLSSRGSYRRSRACPEVPLIENPEPAPATERRPQVPWPETYGTPRPASKPGEPKKPPPKRRCERR
jgi:hypothetical protein